MYNNKKSSLNHIIWLGLLLLLLSNTVFANTSLINAAKKLNTMTLP